MKKRLISLLLALCLCLVLMPTAALAAENTSGAYLVINGTVYVVTKDNATYIANSEGATTAVLPNGVSYNYASNTLTLENASLSALFLMYETNSVKFLPTANLVIQLKGSNSITTPSGGIDGNYKALQIAAGLHATIQGSGSLNLSSLDATSTDIAGIYIQDSASLTISGSAHVTSKTTSASETYIAIAGSTSGGNSLTVGGNAVLEAYGAFGGIDCLNLTAKENATVKTNMIFLAAETGTEGIPLTMTVQDSATVDVRTSYESKSTVTDTVGALSLAYGSKLYVKGGTLNVTQESSNDTANAIYTSYNTESDANSVISVTGGTVNVKSTSYGLYLANCDFSVSGGTVNGEGGLLALMAVKPSKVRFSGGQVTLKAPNSAMTYASNQLFEESPSQLDPDNLPLDEDELANGISVADGLTVTDVQTGKELSVMGSYGHYDTTELNGKNIAAYFRLYGYTVDGNSEIQLNSQGTAVNCAASISIGKADTSSSASTSTSSSAFTDVSKSAYYADAVTWAVENGVTTGTSTTTFSPSASVTRAQAVTFLWRAAGSPDPESTTSPFTDVTDSSAYYYKAVLWAAEQGITTGIGDNQFGLSGTLAYDQILAMLCRAAGDSASGSDWSAAALNWAAENGLTTGLNVSAKANCPRSDVVYCLWKQLG